MTTYRRPRGVRKIPQVRHRAPQDPYGPAHRKRRKQLVALLASTGPWPCPICQRPMVASMGRSLHLHHSDPAAKLRGLPGDQLAHGICNVRDGARLGAAITNASKAGKRATVTPIKPAVRHSREW
jgi:hypothetical protein